MMNQHAMNTYSQTNAHAVVMEASPHKLISLLMKGAMDRMAQAKGAIESENVARKGELISKAVAIVAELQASLDMEKGQQLSANLEALYDYMIRKLVEANRNNDTAVLAELIGLMAEVKQGWDSIAEQAAG